MSFDEFIVWAEGRPGRYELESGEVVTVAPERVRHATVKYAAQSALSSAIKAAGCPCHMLPDGMTVRVAQDAAYEPDALVYCGQELPGDAVEVPAPVLVVEVLSPATAYRDVSGKLAGYFRLESIEHYLIIDPDRRLLVYHARVEGGCMATSIISEGSVTLEPPGLSFDVAYLFPASSPE